MEFRAEGPRRLWREFVGGHLLGLFMGALHKKLILRNWSLSQTPSQVWVQWVSNLLYSVVPKAKIA